MIVCVDFDGVVAKNRFPEIGPMVPGAEFWLKQLQRSGAELWLWTARVSTKRYQDEVRNFGKEAWDICELLMPGMFRGMTSDKIGKLYIDDKMVGAPLLWDDCVPIPYLDWRIVGPQAVELVSSRVHASKGS